MATVAPSLSSSVRRCWRGRVPVPRWALSTHDPPLPKHSRRLRHHDCASPQDQLAAEHDGTHQAESGLKALRRKRRASANQDPPNHQPATVLGQSRHRPVRTRFAPSPTGYLHLGSLRTALFNNLAALASKGGSFILRIEDTDQSRLVPDAENRIIQDLQWAGLSWNEGPDCGGQHGPYRQSERLPIYEKHVQRLMECGHAYRCFCAADQLERQKRQSHKEGKQTVYPGTCRSISSAESQRRAAAGDPHVVRFKGDAFGSLKFDDAIYGPFQKNQPEEDFVIRKTDGFPTYHLANVVDDHLMKITHVIRGEEWLISTPKHLALYQAFGWQSPTFAHLALLVSPDGAKLSKRNQNVSLSKQQDDGVFPLAFLSWLANLGSSFKPDVKPPRSLTDMADALTFKFTKGSVKVNLEKLHHLQTKYKSALLLDPIPKLAEQERQLIETSLVRPLLQQIDSATAQDGHGWRELPNPWQTDLELVPDLKAEETREKYGRNVLVHTSRGPHNKPSSLVKAYPFLFWRVPADLYSASLSHAVPCPKSLEVLARALGEAAAWSSDPAKHAAAAQCLENASRQLAMEPAVAHNVVRLVATGDWCAKAPPTSDLFALLGRDELRFRLAAVQRLLADVQTSPAASVLSPPP